MPEVVATALATDLAFPSGSEIVRVDYGLKRLVVHVEWWPKHDRTAIVVFSDAIALRAADEIAFCEYFTVCNMQNGWIFEIHSRGWLSRDIDRAMFGYRTDVREYLIIGCDDCFNVVSISPPRILDVSPGARNSTK